MCLLMQCIFSSLENFPTLKNYLISSEKRRYKFRTSLTASVETLPVSAADMSLVLSIGRPHTLRSN